MERWRPASVTVSNTNSLDAAALTARFPGYRLPDGLVAVFQPDGGFLQPERCIVAHVNAAKSAHGATVQNTRTRDRMDRRGRPRARDHRPWTI